MLSALLFAKDTTCQHVFTRFTDDKLVPFPRGQLDAWEGVPFVDARSLQASQIASLISNQLKGVVAKN